jgi:radical SAM superfamily enzyme YgiQ (UPF0313 family)
MKIELITPESAPSRRLRRWRLIQFPQLTMPLLAAHTPAGVKLHHTDEIVESVDLDCDADLVAMTCNTPAANHVYRLSAAFRQRGRRVVLGGPHVTALPQEAAQHADAIVIGEGESVWPEVVRDFERGQWQPVYRGSPADLREMPAPRWDLIRGRGYGRTVTIATRGCVHRCGYCSIPFMYSHGQRRRPVGEVAREVAQMPGKATVFWDDYLTANREYALALFRAISPYRKWWTTQTTIRFAFDEILMAEAAASGCKAVFVGFETISQQSLDSQGKRFNQVDLYEKAVTNLHRNGIAIQAGTMFGLDGDDPGIFERTYRYYREIGVDSATVGIVVPMPGTPFFEQMQREGRLLTTNWDLYNGKVNAVFQPRQMEPCDLEQGAAWFADHFYSLPTILHRLLRKSRVGLWWNLPRNIGYRLALAHRERVCFRTNFPVRASRPPIRGVSLHKR